MSKANLTVGQELWWVPNGRHSGVAQTVTVTKVGRKWAHIDNGHRVDVESLAADAGNYASPGNCWFYKEDHDATVRIHAGWRRFHQEVSRMYSPPAHMTTGDIQKMLDIIRGEA